MEKKLEMLEKLVAVQNLLEDIYNQTSEQAKETPKEWGRLWCCENETKHWPMIFGNSFSIGKGKKCNLSIADNTIPSLLARITFNNNSVIIEGKTKRVPLLVNSAALMIGERRTLQDQDTIIVNGTKTWTFVCFI